jgi:pre-mRNA 3'-end-processing factor FIP1
MEIDDDDDFYAPAESIPSGNEQQEQQNRPYAELRSRNQEEDLEEGEEEDEGEEDGSDSVKPHIILGTVVVG